MHKSKVKMDLPIVRIDFTEVIKKTEIVVRSLKESQRAINELKSEIE